MFASPGEMRVEARRHAVRVQSSKASWNENIEDVLKHNGVLTHKTVSSPHHQNTNDGNDQFQDFVSEEDRMPSPIVEDHSRPVSRPTPPRSSASRKSHEIRNGLGIEGQNTRQTIVKFQLFT